jgi:hypothetical protein
LGRIPNAAPEGARLRLQPLAQRGADRVAQLEDRLVRDRAIDRVPLLAAGDEPRLLQHLEVLRDVRLRGLDPLGDLRDAQLPALQGLEDAEPQRLGQHPEARRHERQRLRRHQLVFARHV